mmetsp:Transcript_43359/g.102089  ORF Transcript_43359/g.102089 Transcript_43359/m.102089 type:complete len:83 (+) Transcript_43359:811-1059(+)
MTVGRRAAANDLAEAAVLRRGWGGEDEVELADELLSEELLTSLLDALLELAAGIYGCIRLPCRGGTLSKTPGLFLLLAFSIW